MRHRLISRSDLGVDTGSDRYSTGLNRPRWNRILGGMVTVCVVRVVLQFRSVLTFQKPSNTQLNRTEWSCRFAARIVLARQQVWAYNWIGEIELADG